MGFGNVFVAIFLGIGRLYTEVFFCQSLFFLFWILVSKTYKHIRPYMCWPMQSHNDTQILVKHAKADTVDGWQRGENKRHIQSYFSFCCPNVNTIWMQFTVIICQTMPQIHDIDITAVNEDRRKISTRHCEKRMATKKTRTIRKMSILNVWSSVILILGNSVLFPWKH